MTRVAGSLPNTLVRTLLSGAATSSGANSSSWDLNDDGAAALADGTYTYKIDATDAATNNAAQQTGTVTIDKTKPDVTVEQAAGQTDPTNSLPIHFTANFSEHVNGFSASDVSLGGSANHSSATVTLTAGAGNSYDIAVSGLSSEGSLSHFLGWHSASQHWGGTEQSILRLSP